MCLCRVQHLVLRDEIGDTHGGSVGSPVTSEKGHEWLKSMEMCQQKHERHSAKTNIILLEQWKYNGLKNRQMNKAVRLIDINERYFPQHFILFLIFFSGISKFNLILNLNIKMTKTTWENIKT